MAVLPREIRKRDGTLVAFDPEQIRRAIDRAAAEAGVRDPGVIGKAAHRAVDQVAARFDGRAPTVEQVQDAADVRHAFVTAAQVPPEAHLAMQAAVQRHIDAGVSKTVNLPASATVDEVKRIYLEAWRAGVKGITVYRYGSKPGQVLTYLAEPPRQAPIQVDGAYAGGCAHHVCEY